MSKDTDVMSQSGIQVNGWPGAFVECKRVVVLTGQGGEEELGFVYFFGSGGGLLGWRNSLKVHKREGQSGKFPFCHIFCFLFYVRDNLLILSSLCELLLFFPAFRVEPVI